MGVVFTIQNAARIAPGVDGDAVSGIKNGLAVGLGCEAVVESEASHVIN